MLVWTNEKPADAGWYWLLEKQREKTLVNVERYGVAAIHPGYLYTSDLHSDREHVLVMNIDGQWAGPIAEPFHCQQPSTISDKGFDGEVSYERGAFDFPKTTRRPITIDDLHQLAKGLFPLDLLEPRNPEPDVRTFASC